LSTSIEENKIDTEKQVSDRLINLIGILFSVVIGRSLIDFRMDLLFPSTSNALRLFALFIVYGSIISSWRGYHMSITRYPYLGSKGGHKRFTFDVFIVIVYTILIYSVCLLGITTYNDREIAEHDGMIRITILFTIIFLFYYIQGVIKQKEHGKEASRPKLSGSFTVLFALLSFLYWIETKYRLVNISVQILDFISLVIILILHVIYRFLREKAGYPINSRTET